MNQPLDWRCLDIKAKRMGDNFRSFRSLDVQTLRLFAGWLHVSGQPKSSF